MTFFQFQILSSKMGQVLKAMEKLIELQTQALQSLQEGECPAQQVESAG